MAFLDPLAGSLTFETVCCEIFESYQPGSEMDLMVVSVLPTCNW